MIGSAVALSVDDLSPAELLRAARDRREAAERAEADLLQIALQWAVLHPAESIVDAAVFTAPGGEHAEPLAGPGTPVVAEFCLAELGSVLSMSTTAAKRLVGDALELAHRLPRLWAGVQAGRVPAWRARRVAQATAHPIVPGASVLSVEACGWVDAQVAPFAAKVGAAQLDRLIAEAVTRFGDPVELPDPDDPHPEVPDRRHVTFDRDELGYAGTMRLEAELDLADALDLDHAVRQGAETLKALGSAEPLDARRALALGELARHQLALDLADSRGNTGCRGDSDEAGTNGGVPTRSRAGLPPARQVVLHVHLSAAALTGDPATGAGLVVGRQARLEEGQRLVLLDSIKAWCDQTLTTVTVKPVLDLAEELTAPGYAIPDRIRDQITLRDRTCVFPHCSRPARRCQLDHVIPYDHSVDARDADAAEEKRRQPGPTASSNLACLCTFHHRVKTHGGWSYVMVAPGVFEWTSPHGHRYLRDSSGTTPLDPALDELTRRRRRLPRPGTPPTRPSPG